MTLPLVRLDNNLWRYTPEPKLPQEGELPLTEIQITTPLWGTAKTSYLFAQIVAAALQEQKISYASELSAGFDITVADTDSKLLGKWHISLATHDSFFDWIFQAFPFTRQVRDKQIAVITGVKEEASFYSLISKLFSKRVHSPAQLVNKKMEPPLLERKLASTWPEQLNTPLFEDAYTELATTIFGTYDPYFVSEEQVLAAYRFVITDTGVLTLQEIRDGAITEEEKQENRQVVQAYKQFIIDEFGINKLRSITSAYGFSFDDLINQGLPLVPDHVFKTNIGMNSIELGDIQSVYNKLLQLKKMIQETSKPPLSEIYPNPISLSALFANKEHRKIQKLAPTQEQLVRFLNEFASNIPSVKDLPPDQFNQLAELVMPTNDEREKAYTGRKIRHLAICGNTTMGDPNIFNPSRNQFELMQLFDQFRKTEDWENYLELTSHVAAKNNLFRKTPSSAIEVDKEWHVGILIPAPTSQEGELRWYYNEAFFDDDRGNVNYVLLPACNGYLSQNKMLPLIKTYRSTSSNLSAVSWMESLEADLNPYGSPGSLDPTSSFAYEKQYIDDRTIPLWAGYLLLAEKTAEQRRYKQALSEYLRCIEAPGRTPPEKLNRAKQLSQTLECDSIREFLISEAKELKQLPEDKIAQDIIYAGHSLGAGLSQFGDYYFGARRSRIPLPGCNFLCYSSRAPGIDTYQDALFMQFGRDNAELIVGLGQQWKVRQDLEYGDFVPESGQSHMGTTGYNESQDSPWLNMHITIFKPLETAHALGITTMHTHARRTGMAVEAQDFEQETLSAQTLSDFDHSWWMTAEQVNTFGLRILRSSKLTEAVRQIFAVISRPLVYLIDRLHSYFWPSLGARDENGVWCLQYEPPTPTL